MEEKTLNRKSAPLLDDYIFKRTFTRDDPNGILRDLLESILKIKIRNVLVLNSEIPKDLLDEKTSKEEYVDLGYNPEEETATDVLEMHFIELPKFIKKNPEAKTKLEQWLWLIAGREDKIKMSKLDNPKVKKAMKLVEEVLSDPVEREILDAREMARLNYNSEMDYMREKGLNEGRKKRNRRTDEKSGRIERSKRNS